MKWNHDHLFQATGVTEAVARETKIACPNSRENPGQWGIDHQTAAQIGRRTRFANGMIFLIRAQIERGDGKQELQQHEVAASAVCLNKPSCHKLF